MIKSVKIGYSEYAVCLVPAKRMGDDYGEFRSHDQEILLSQSLSGPELVATLLHEIFHGIYHQYDVKDDDNEERTVAALSNGLMAVFKDNPALLAFIKKNI